MYVTDMLLMTGAPAAELLDAARPAFAAAETWGLHQREVSLPRFNVAEAFITQGDPDRAWEIVAPQTEGDPNQDGWSLHEQRAVLELLRGRPHEARRHITAVADGPLARGGLAFRLGFSATAATIELWDGESAAALERALTVLESGKQTEEPAILAPLLVLAARAAADLGDRDNGDRLRKLHQRLAGDPFAPHPMIVTPVALGATWSAELARLQTPRHRRGLGCGCSGVGPDPPPVRRGVLPLARRGGGAADRPGHGGSEAAQACRPRRPRA